MKIQGKTIKMLRFADDIALLGNTEKELEEALNVMETVFTKYNMKVNIEKTKVIACRTITGFEYRSRNQKETAQNIRWSMALYRCEAWTIGKGGRKRLEAFEM